MGCIFSSFEEDEKVGIFKERKKLIKQLVVIRGEFSGSVLAYSQALRNIGGTLRRYTESDFLEYDNASNGLAGPSSPHTHLASSPVRPPPPLPPLTSDKATTAQVPQGEILEYDYSHVPAMQIDPDMGSWIFSTGDQTYELVEQVEVEDENWEETKTEFEEEDLEQSRKQLVDDTSSVISKNRKDSNAMPMVVIRRDKTLEGIAKELDDYFLIASPCIKEIAVLMDISGGDTLLRQNSGHLNGKRGRSAKVFSILSRSWYSKSPHFGKDAAEHSGPSEPCRPGAHCATLKKLYAAEKTLFRAVKEEGIAKLEFERKSILLQRQEAEQLDWDKVEKTRSSVENLESVLLSLRQSISETSSSILELIDYELLPQLVALTAGLNKMWRTMHECHQAQLSISQQLSNLSDNQNTILNSEYHREATSEFETQASYWYASFCKLVKSQREYVSTLCRWIQHTNWLQEGHEYSNNSSVILSICQQWEQGLDQLPDKEASDEIRSLLLSIRSIIEQQAKEDNILKNLEKLERRLRKSLNSLTEMEEKLKFNYENGDIPVNMSPMHPLSLKKSKTEALKKQVENMKVSYLASVQHNRVMTLNNLKTRLPHLFQSLVAFTSASAEAIEVINNNLPVECTDIESQN